MANFGYQNPPMAHFHGVVHGNCALRYLGGFLVLRKLDLRGLKGQFDVRKVNFRGLIVKIGQFWLPEPTNGPFSWSTLWELYSKVLWMGSSDQKVRI